MNNTKVATVLTVYGIETHGQQLLPHHVHRRLQQSLPFTVLKQPIYATCLLRNTLTRCNSPYRLRY